MYLNEDEFRFRYDCAAATKDIPIFDDDLDSFLGEFNGVLKGVDIFGCSALLLLLLFFLLFSELPLLNMEKNPLVRDATTSGLMRCDVMR